MENNIDIIKRIDFLQELDEPILTKIAEQFQEISYPKGKVLFNENEVGECFYIVKSGKISLTKKLKIAENVTGELSFFSPYDYFGELALIDNEPRSGTATVFEDAVLLKICKEEFLAICKDHPKVLFNIVRTMSGRLRITNDKFIAMWDELLIQGKLAAVGTAAGKIVHDIKTPLTVIILTAQLIGNVYEGTSDFTEKIVAQVQKVDQMVREILEFARGGTIEMNIARVNLESFFSELTEDIAPILEINNVNFTLHNNVDRPAKIDRIKINRVLINLIKNSIDAMNKKPGEIIITANIDNERLHIAVEDDGTGIPEDYLPTLFEPFVTYKKKTGTGLGLAICKKVVNDHKGQITVSNRPEGGARFDIYLPCNDVT